jgi:hypothetical protein
MTSSNDPDCLPRAYMTLNVETDGPNPSRNNLLELAAILHLEDGTVLEEFNKKLSPDVSAREPDEFTMRDFWSERSEAYAWVCQDAIDAAEAMQSFSEFYRRNSKMYSIRCVGAPASKDFVWVAEYCIHFTEGKVRLPPYCRCLNTMRRSYQKMMGLTDSEAWALRIEMQGGQSRTHRGFGIESAKAQAQEFCFLRKAMYKSCTHLTHEHYLKRDNEHQQNITNISSCITQLTRSVEGTLEELKSIIAQQSTNLCKTLEELKSMRLHQSTNLCETLEELKSMRAHQSTSLCKTLEELKSMRAHQSKNLCETLEELKSMRAHQSTNLCETLEEIKSIRAQQNTNVRETLEEIKSIRAQQNTNVRETLEELKSIRAEQNTNVIETLPISTSAEYNCNVLSYASEDKDTESKNENFSENKVSPLCTIQTETCHRGAFIGAGVLLGLSVMLSTIR